MLERMTVAIDRATKALQPTTKSMPLEVFVDYALDQIRKAGQDEPEMAARRIEALRKATSGAMAVLAKLNAEDLDSEKIHVEVETAWAPAKADGDKPMDLTTAAEQTVTELAPASVKTPESMDLALSKLAKEIEGLRAPARKAAPSAAAPKPDDTWPSDLNTKSFREGVQKSERTLTWGRDPEQVRRAKEA